jgi:signal transduction histidine kinase
MSKIEQTASLGVGMRGMNERVRQLGWELKVSSGDKGMSIRAIIPTPGSSSTFARAGSWF